MIPSTLFFIFLYFSLALVAIAFFSKSQLLAIIAGIILMASSFSALTGGIQDYDGSMNRTIRYTFTDSTNATVNQTATTEIANYVIKNDTNTQMINLISLLGGIGFFMWGVFTPRGTVEQRGGDV